MELLQSEIITPTVAASAPKYSYSIRMWHWLNAVIITCLLLTVLINSTVLKPWTNSSFITAKLSEKGVKLTEDQSRSVAFALADKVWTVHVWLGYALAALFFYRLTAESLELADKKLIGKIKSAKKAFLLRQADRIEQRNEMLIKTLYALFYVLLMVMVITGLALAFRDSIPALKPLHFIKEIHGFTMYFILAFTVIHIAGVVLGEKKTHKGIVSDMINGGTVTR